MLFIENPQGKGDYNTIRYQVRDFTDVGMDQFVIGLKKEGAPKNTFVNLTPHLDRTLRDILRGEKVIEFPTIYIWLQDQLDENVMLEEKLFVEYRPRSNRRSSKDQHSTDIKTTKKEKDDNDNDMTKNEEINSNEQLMNVQAEGQQEAVAEEEKNNINNSEEIANAEKPSSLPCLSNVPLTNGDDKNIEENQPKDDGNGQSDKH